VDGVWAEELSGVRPDRFRARPPES
jgi:hypothetical protein